MRPLSGFNRALLAVALGLGLSMLLIEATLRLIELTRSGPLLMELIAAGALQQPAWLLVLGLIALLAGAAGGALASAMSHCALLAVPVGLASGLPLAASALVGVQPLGFVVALALLPLLGALLAARAVEQLRRLDGADGSPAEVSRDGR
ncbi:MAG: hypothetical protein ACXIUM_02540 [Wenzhouxiangella sp.]